MELDQMGVKEEPVDEIESSADVIPEQVTMQQNNEVKVELVSDLNRIIQLSQPGSQQTLPAQQLPQLQEVHHRMISKRSHLFLI